MLKAASSNWAWFDEDPLEKPGAPKPGGDMGGSDPKDELGEKGPS